MAGCCKQEKSRYAYRALRRQALEGMEQGQRQALVPAQRHKHRDAGASAPELVRLSLGHKKHASTPLILITPLHGHLRPNLQRKALVRQVLAIMVMQIAHNWPQTRLLTQF
jgi:hypothetical protein